MGTGSFPWVK